MSAQTMACSRWDRPGTSSRAALTPAAPTPGARDTCTCHASLYPSCAEQQTSAMPCFTWATDLVLMLLQRPLDAHTYICTHIAAGAGILGGNQNHGRHCIL